MGYFDGKPVKPKQDLLGDLPPDPEPAPVVKVPARKLDPVPLPGRPRPVSRSGWTPLQAVDPWGQWPRMRQLLERVKQGEDLETVKRELWPEEYRGERD